MNICSIGRVFENVRTIEFSSSHTILEFDAIIIDTLGLASQEYAPRTLVFRHQDFFEFVSSGRTAMVLMGSTRINDYISLDPIRLTALSGQRFDFKGPDFLKTFWSSVESDMQYLVQLDTDHCPGKPFLFVPSTKKPLATWIKIGLGNLLLIPFLIIDRAHPKNRADLLDSLFSTVGVFKNHSDWKSFIASSAPEPPKAK